jgi:hypothetical protein
MGLRLDITGSRKNEKPTPTCSFLLWYNAWGYGKAFT